jgi:UDP-3-O-[3-hydroxymyristoyl] N-acetylglucosamine deacetylase
MASQPAFVRGHSSARGLRASGSAPVRVIARAEMRRGARGRRGGPGSTRPTCLVIDFRIEFADAKPSARRIQEPLTMANGAFVRELCDSRTFCLQADVDRMRENGLALGGTL